MKRKRSTEPKAERLDYLVAKPSEIQAVSLDVARINKANRQNQLDQFVSEHTTK